MANIYKETALAAARAADVSPQTIRSARFAVVASFAGVVLGPDNETPDGFNWRNVRRFVAFRRHLDQRDDMLAAIAIQMQTAIRTRTGWDDAIVTVDADEQAFRVHRAKFTTEG